jgi:hypothetical protein
MGEEPGKVPDVVKFELYKESAEAIEANHEKNKKQTQLLESTQKYRAPLPRKDFERSFKPRFGPIQTVQSVEGGVVTNSAGESTLVKQVQIVKPGSSEVTPPDFGSVGSRLKPALRRYAEALKPYLRAGPVSLTTAAKKLNQEEGFSEAKGNLTFLQFIKLFEPEMFKTTGSRSQTKVALKTR